MDPLHALLAPRPQQLERRPGTWTWPEVAGIAHGPAVSSDTARRVVELLGREGCPARCGPDDALVVLQVDPSAAPAQGYRLQMGPEGVTVVGADPAGVWYGALTLVQVLRLTGPQTPLPTLSIVDWPDIPRRGVMLDISRDKVPTMETLYACVELLAELKVNELQLYMEHTFAYAGHEVVWEHASPMTPAEIRALDGFCRARHMSLVPNQNSFGHMHRWLIHDAYRPLEEVPEGIDHPFSAQREPFGLCPIDPGSLALVQGLYDQLLPCFSAGTVNVGGDETIDLGLGRSAEACQARGKTTVYLEFLRALHADLAVRGHRMQFWGDIILKDPSRIGELPPDAIALLWGYEADHPFHEQAERFQRAGLEFYVCPGTSAWNSLVGRTDNALGNLRAAALSARDHRAAGVLITDWGDYGHLQPLPVSYLGWVAGASYAWNVDHAAAADGAEAWAPRLDAHVFRDRAGKMGEAALGLGNLYQLPGLRHFNGSGLFWLLLYPEGLKAHHWPEGLGEDGFRQVLRRLEALTETLQATAMGRVDGPWLREEFLWAAELTALAARLGLARLSIGREASLSTLDPRDASALCAALDPLVEAHGILWDRRNRPGGRGDSVRRLETLQGVLARANGR